jgi:hypothetical protein
LLRSDVLRTTMTTRRMRAVVAEFVGTALLLAAIVGFYFVTTRGRARRRAARRR